MDTSQKGTLHYGNKQIIHHVLICWFIYHPVNCVRLWGHIHIKGLGSISCYDKDKDHYNTILYDGWNKIFHGLDIRDSIVSLWKDFHFSQLAILMQSLQNPSLKCCLSWSTQSHCQPMRCFTCIHSACAVRHPMSPFQSCQPSWWGHLLGHTQMTTMLQTCEYYILIRRWFIMGSEPFVILLYWVQNR